MIHLPETVEQKLIVDSGPNQALLERISFLEGQLSAYTNGPIPEKRETPQTVFERQPLVSPLTSEPSQQTSSIADIVGRVMRYCSTSARVPCIRVAGFDEGSPIRGSCYQASY